MFSINPDKIKERLKTKYIGREMYFYDECTSTFDMAKHISPKHGSLIVAKKQTNGRGRLGRQWISDGGGVYFSVILMPDISPDNLYLITAQCAVAVKRAISKYIPCKIKWPNDIVSEDGKKLCGILTRSEITSAKVTANVGIGINANIEYFSSSLPYAASIKSYIGTCVDENELLCDCLLQMEECCDFKKLDNIMEEYRKSSATLGSRVSVLGKDGKAAGCGLCTDINNDGSIIIEFDDGKKEMILFGEVSVRGIYGEAYV